MNDVLRNLNRTIPTVSNPTWYSDNRDPDAPPFSQFRTCICYDKDCRSAGTYHRHTLPLELIDLLHDIDRWEYNLTGALRYRTP